MTDNLSRIFKAFFPTKGKAPSKQYTKPENQFRLEEVCNMPSYGGLLADDAILVDIDDSVEGAILLEIIKALKIKCRVHQTTRGIHAFFLGHNVQSTKTQVINAIGLETDYKLGTKKGISILKLEGVERNVLYETEDIEPLPAWLYPTNLKKSNAPDFINLAEGDGRNSIMFEWILTLQSAGLTKEQSREAIKVINKFVLKDPLPTKEIDTILRDDSFPTESFYDQKGKLKVREFEEHFCNETHAIKIDGNLHIYDNGVYVEGDERIRGEMLDYLPDLTYAQRNEILNRSKDRIRYSTERSTPSLIPFKNGIYNVETKTLEPMDYHCIVTNKMDWEYNPNAYCEITDKTLDRLSCGDSSIRALLEEMIGYCFYRRNLGKVFLLLGDASNGKSTFLYMIIRLLGRDNVSALNLQELDSRFKTAELFNKMANIGDDIPATWVPDASMLKKIATGDRLNAERKGQNPFEFEPYAKLMFSANEMPRIEDKTGAVKRRIVPVPFKAVFSPQDPDYDPFIKDKLSTKDSMEYLIKIGLEGLDRVLTSNGFTVNADIERELKTIDEINNPIIGFLDDVGEDAIYNQSTKKVYGMYRDYCVECGIKEMAMNTFVSQINKRLGTTVVRKMINKENFKVFERK